MFATFVYQENKMEFYAAWDLAESQISSQQAPSNLQRKPHLPAPLLAKTDPYQHLESEEDDDSSSDSSSEDKKTDGLNDESMEEKDGLNDECKEEKEKTSDSDTEESDMQEDEMKQKTDEPPSPTNSEVQNLLTMASGVEKKEESQKKEKDEEEKTTTEVKELKRPTSEPVSDPVVQKLRKIAKDLDEGECILDTLTQALYDSGVEAQAVGATPKWMPPPQQAPQPVRAKAPEQLPIKAKPTHHHHNKQHLYIQQQPKLHHKQQPKHHTKQQPKHHNKQQPKHHNKHLLVLGPILNQLLHLHNTIQQCTHLRAVDLQVHQVNHLQRKHRELTECEALEAHSTKAIYMYLCLLWYFF